MPQRKKTEVHLLETY